MRLPARLDALLERQAWSHSSRANSTVRSVLHATPVDQVRARGRRAGGRIAARSYRVFMPFHTSFD